MLFFSFTRYNATTNFSDPWKKSFFEKRVRKGENDLKRFTHFLTMFCTLLSTAFDLFSEHVRKRENSCNKYFIPLPTMFSTKLKTVFRAHLSHIHVIVCKCYEFGQV